MKTCGKCGATKPRAEGFYAGHSYCKPCHSRATAARAKANPEKTRGYQRAWRERNPDAARSQRLKRYGLSLNSFDLLLELQDGACAICRTTDPGGKGNWHIDHDHSCCPEQERSCGDCVRGLLCWRCNIGISHFNDDPEALMRAAAYVGASQAARG